MATLYYELVDSSGSTGRLTIRLAGPLVEADLTPALVDLGGLVRGVSGAVIVQASHTRPIAITRSASFPIAGPYDRRQLHIVSSTDVVTVPVVWPISTTGPEGWEQGWAPPVGLPGAYRIFVTNLWSAYRALRISVDGFDPGDWLLVWWGEVTR